MLEYCGSSGRGQRHSTSKKRHVTRGQIIQLRAATPAPIQPEAKRSVKRAIDMVCERLGDTRAVFSKYYVHSVPLDAELQG